jgi:hypothetical protein
MLCDSIDGQLNTRLIKRVQLFLREYCFGVDIILKKAQKIIPEKVCLILRVCAFGAFEVSQIDGLQFGLLNNVETGVPGDFRLDFRRQSCLNRLIHVIELFHHCLLHLLELVKAMLQT